MTQNYIVTIDGPTGAGKSTIGKLLARKQGMIYLDTGAMYRAVAFEVLRKGIDPDNEADLREVCAHIDISFKQNGDGQRVYANGEDVTDAIRTPEISMLASRVSAVRCVREALVDMQRTIGKRGRIVVDGRDAGTVIFPKAHMKFYLDADLSVRAERRYKELVAKKIKVDYNCTFKDVKDRDEGDSGRKISPLRPAADAVILDTTQMTIEDVLDAMVHIIEQRAASLP